MSEVEEFEQKIAEFFGAPFAVGTDSCTHAIELCLRYVDASYISVPRRTYLSVAMLAEKLDIARIWSSEQWIDYYNLFGKVFDAAVLWQKNSYIKGTMMCVSFQYAKHLSIGRAGIILLDNKYDADMLRKMAYDGRLPNVPWREQDIQLFGYHYYLQPELVEIGLSKLDEAIAAEPRQWTIDDYPDISKMEVFK